MLEINESINKLRDELYQIIEQKSYDISDPKVIEASVYVNNAIAAYSTSLKLDIE